MQEAQPSSSATNHGIEDQNQFLYSSLVNYDECDILNETDDSSDESLLETAGQYDDIVWANNFYNSETLPRVMCHSYGLVIIFLLIHIILLINT